MPKHNNYHIIHLTKLSRQISMPKLLASVGLVCTSLLFSAATQAKPNSQLTVEVNGLRNQQGQICLSLFANDKGFPSSGADAMENRCVAIRAIPQLVTFKNLPPGGYAVAVLHDVNSDSKANRNFLGIPREGFGFSRNPAIRTRAPQFNDAVVLVAGKGTNIQIQLKYLLGSDRQNSNVEK